MKEYVINVSPFETRIALLEDNRLAELNVERAEARSVVGNIYKGRVDSVVPGIQAAFIDIGLERNGFLYVGDIAGAEGTGDFDFEEGRRPSDARSRRRGRSSIEKVLKKGQSIMVQVEKDTLGTKGVRLTNYVTFPGRYVVLMPTVTQIGVSRKIADPGERDRLRATLQTFRRERKFGLIIRTAGEGKPKREINNDMRYLNRLWERVKRKMDKADAPALLHEDLSPILRKVRDTFTDDIDRLTIDDPAEHKAVVDFLDIFAPQLKDRCKLYKKKRPIFDDMGVEKQILDAMNRRVELKSGGHIVIDQTEALIAIDVNTGRFTGKKRLEETVFHTNMEAAEEIARQMRLRDLGGIIVVDFIDMELAGNRKKLLRKCIDALKADRAKTSVSDIGELGMIEMTRKRVKHNLVKALSQTCPYCAGSAHVRSITTMTFDAVRSLQAFFCKNKAPRVIVQVHPDVARRLRTENKSWFEEMAGSFDREVLVESVSDFHIHDIRVLDADNRKEIANLGVTPLRSDK